MFISRKRNRHVPKSKNLGGRTPALPPLWHMPEKNKQTQKPLSGTVSCLLLQHETTLRPQGKKAQSCNSSSRGFAFAIFYCPSDNVVISTQSLKSSFFEVGPNPDCSATVTFHKALTKQEVPNRLLGRCKKACLFSKLQTLTSCFFICHFVFLRHFTEFFFSTKAQMATIKKKN